MPEAANEPNDQRVFGAAFADGPQPSFFAIRTLKMPVSLPYGIASSLQLPVSPEQLTGCFVGEATGLDAAQALQAALDEPLDYPQLEQAVVPGDRVAIVLDRYVPHAAEATAAVVNRLLACGISAEAMTVVYPEGTVPEPLAVRASQTVPAGEKSAAGVHVEVHNPDDRNRVSYLGNTLSGRGIYVNRTLGEADFVIPIGSPRGAISWNYHGPLGAIYPLLSDRDTQKRYRNPALLFPTGETAERAQVEVDAVGWQSGAQFTVQVLPGCGDETAAIVAGEIRAVRKRAEQMFDARHRHHVEARSKTVVAALTGAANQTWEQFAVALGVAASAVEEGGAIAICSDLQEPLGPALDLLTKCGDDRDEVEAHIRKERPVDLFPALTLIETQRRARVYLISKLDDETVENLGMTAVADADDIGRLASRRGSCLVLGDAQHARLDAIPE